MPNPYTALAAPVDITPATTGSYQDVDLDSYVANLPSGVTGAAILIINSDSANKYLVDWRKNGSTDTFTEYIRDTYGAGNNFKASHFVGVDANNVLEIYVEDNTSVKVYLTGYFGDGVTFLTNAVDKSISSTLSWADVDCSASAPAAAGLIFRVHTTGTSLRSCGLRKNGSTDNRTGFTPVYGGAGGIIGCDTSQICEHYINGTAQDLYLIGYITANATFNTNASNLSLSSSGDWYDLAAFPEGAIAGIIETSAADDYYLFGLRTNGSSDTTTYAEINRHEWDIIAGDVNRVAECKISSTSVDTYLVGYFTAIASTDSYSGRGIGRGICRGVMR